MEHYWNDSEGKKMLPDRSVSFWILPPQIPLGMTCDWSEDYKLPGLRQSFRAMAPFLSC